MVNCYLQLLFYSFKKWVEVGKELYWKIFKMYENSDIFRFFTLEKDKT